jgi:hypothetical protein
MYRIETLLMRTATLICHLLLSAILFSSLSVSAQAQIAAMPDTNASKQKDLIDIFHSVVGRKAHNSSNTAMENGRIHWSVIPGVGYTLQNGFAAVLSGNAAFYAAASPMQNMSSVNTSIAATQKNQFTVVVQPNIWSAGNKQSWVGDYRFMIYPQETYGLGGHTRLTDISLINYNLVRINQSVYFKVKGDLYAGIGYSLNYHYNIHESGKDSILTDDVYAVDPPLVTTAKTVSSGISFNVLYDQRRNANNPMAGGKYLSIQFLNNTKLLGSDNDWQSLIIDARKYVGVGSKKENKLALWTYGWFTFNNNAPYLDLPSTGWDAYNNLGRGYTQSRFRGKNLVYAEAEYRMNLSHDHLLGGVAFLNAQSVTDWPSNRFTTIHPGVGGGVRIKFNKHSNTNIALDYAFGTDGSKGVFVNLGEVF